MTSTGRHTVDMSVCWCLDRRGLCDDHRFSRGLHLLQRHHVLHSVLHGSLLLLGGALVQVRPCLGRHVHLLRPRPGACSREYSTCLFYISRTQRWQVTEVVTATVKRRPWPLFLSERICLLCAYSRLERCQQIVHFQWFFVGTISLGQVLFH